MSDNDNSEFEGQAPFPDDNLLRTSAYIFDHYSDDELFNKEETVCIKALAKLLLAEAQELLYNDILMKEIKENRHSESLLAKVAMGTCDLYSLIDVNNLAKQTQLKREIKNKRHLFRALAQKHHLAYLKSKSQTEYTECTEYTEVYCRSVDLLNSITAISAAEIRDCTWSAESLQLVTNLGVDINEQVHAFLRKYGAIDYDERLVEVESRVLVTAKEVEFDFSRSDLLPSVPYYSYYKSIKEHSLQEQEIAKSYRSLIAYNKNNIFKLVASMGWNNVVCLYSAVGVNEFKQLGDFITNVIPAKRSQLKETLAKNSANPIGPEIGKYLNMGYKVDEENLSAYSRLDQNVIFNMPSLALNSILEGLKPQSRTEESNIKVLLKLLDTSQRYVLELISKKHAENLKEPKYEQFLRATYPAAKTEPRFDYQNAFRECIDAFYDSKYKKILAEIDSFIIEVSGSEQNTARTASECVLFDENIAKYNREVLAYQKLCRNVEQGLQFYSNLQSSLQPETDREK